MEISLAIDELALAANEIGIRRGIYGHRAIGLLLFTKLA
jgi:hypothetical protein